MDISSIMAHVNAIRERHHVAPLRWALEVSRRAWDLLELEASQQGSVSTNRSFGDNFIMGLDGSVDPTTACIQALDIWQVRISHHFSDRPSV